MLLSSVASDGPVESRVGLDEGSDPAAPSRPAVMSLRDATLSYGGTIAVADVSFELHRGEVLALLGENGAGKSSCVKLLGGIVNPDRGSVMLGGRPIKFGSARDAGRQGIAVVHQVAALYGDLDITENVFAATPLTNRFGSLDRPSMEARTRSLLEQLGIDLDPGRQVRTLRTSEQQLVEIARALATEAQVLILDEPTAALSTREVERLFTVIERLRSRDVAMLFVSHRMEEVFRIADSVAVLRDGRLVASKPRSELDPAEAVRLMVGRSLSGLYPEPNPARGDVVLEASELSGPGFEDVSFDVRSGEILGFAGLVGSGRTEVARVLFGIEQATGGEMRLDGQPVRLGSPAEALRSGIAYLSEDRRGQSLIAQSSILENATLTVLDQVTRFGIVRPDRQRNAVLGYLTDLRLRYQDADQPVGTLSGGNQQKVVLAKWLATRPRLLVLDEPTQGIDVQTKAEVHRTIAALAAEGMAIILISSELPEIVGMSDRVVVFREGRAITTLARGEATQEAIASAAMDVAAARMAADDGSTSTAVPETSSGDGHGVGIASASGSEPGPEVTVKRRAEPSWLRHAAGSILASRQLGLVAAILAVAIPVTAINPRFSGYGNIASISTDVALLAIVALGEMLVLLTRNIDVSVASIIGLSAYASAAYMSMAGDVPVITGVLVAVVVGLACGLINGSVVTIGRVPSVVVTFGTLAIFRGLDSLIANGNQVSADEVPAAWLAMTSTRVAGIPPIVLVGIAVVVIGAWVLRSRPAARELFMAGSDPEAARVNGIRVDWRVLGAFAAAGALAGLAGALWASRYATIDARVATGYELTVIAAVVVGGVSLRGGSGSVLGVVLAATLLLVVQNGLAVIRVDPLSLPAVYGGVILAAVAIDTLVGRRSAGRTAARRAKSPQGATA